MTSASSKALPFIVLAVAFFLAIYEAQTGREINVELLVPILAPIGVAGAAKAAIEGIAKVKPTAKQIVQQHQQGQASS